MTLTDEHYSVLREADNWGTFFLDGLATDPDHGVKYDDVYDIIYDLIECRMIWSIASVADGEIYCVAPSGWDVLEARNETW